MTYILEQERASKLGRIAGFIAFIGSSAYTRHGVAASQRCRTIRRLWPR